MFKYMKYEIKGTYKYILGVLALVLVLFIGNYLYFNNMDGGSIGGAIFINISALVIFGAALTTFLYIVGSFRKELYEDRGYLTFTLPLSGNQIVASKLIVALLYFVLLSIVLVLFPVIFILTSAPMHGITIGDFFLTMTRYISIQQIVFAILTAILSVVNVLIFIYFSMALSRVTFRNKKIGGLWFVIFLVISSLFSYGQFKISELFPYYLDLNTLDIGTMDMFREQLMLHVNTGMFSLPNPGMAVANIAGSIFAIIVTIGAFLGTGYLIENKVDL